MIRTALAVSSGKLARLILNRAGRGATALPGLVALAVDPLALASLTASLEHGAVCVSGTNGKTTTSRMLADIVRAAGWAPVHNRSGSNLDRGIVAALLADSSWTGAPRSNVGILEVDEATLPRVLARMAPRVVVVTNLFRDQLDRYFEIDALAKRIGGAIARLPASTTLVLNADDPIVAQLAHGHRGPVTYFGVDDPKAGGTVAQSISDATRCPRCRAPLQYRRVVLAHIGDWSCSACRFTRPERGIAASAVELSADATTIRIAAASGTEETVTVPLPGLYNAYNALAALAAAGVVGIGLPTAARALASFRPAFGRLETVQADDRTLRLMLVKNPAGFNAAIGALLETGRHPRLLAALNDRDADGRDVSWIWDADFESLAPRVAHAVVTGLRSRDLAVRLKYAGVDPARIEVVDGWKDALLRAIGAAAQGEEVVVVATYTAMLALRGALADMGYVGRFWED
ncbi:MAG: MurT ligase domain-containing protein [Candidatus Limnocylindria bacterium]